MTNKKELYHNQIFAILSGILNKTEMPEIKGDIDQIMKLFEEEHLDGFLINSPIGDYKPDTENLYANIVAQKLMFQTAIAVGENAKKNNIPIAFFKGPIITASYPDTIFRSSSDIDIYVPQEYEKQFEAMMLSMGASKETDIDFKQCAEADFVFNGKILFEAHYVMCTWLYDSQREYLSKANIFDKDSFIEVQTSDGTYNTLDVTDHLFLLIYHFWSHFAYRDHNCIRMLCDIKMFTDKYYDSINIQKLRDTLENTGFMKLGSAIFSLCTQSLNMKDLGFKSSIKDIKKIKNTLMWKVGKMSDRKIDKRSLATFDVFDITAIHDQNGKIVVKQKIKYKNLLNIYNYTWIKNFLYWKVYKGQKMHG